MSFDVHEWMTNLLLREAEEEEQQMPADPQQQQQMDPQAPAARQQKSKSQATPLDALRGAVIKSVSVDPGSKTIKILTSQSLNPWEITFVAGRVDIVLPDGNPISL